MENCKKLTAVVTGAASGIGKAIANALGEAGCALRILDINTERGQSAAEELSAITESKFIRCDIGSIESINEAFDAILADGEADILVNAAGIPVRDYIEDITVESWERFMNINVRSVFFMSQRFAEAIRARGGNFGRIINISSVRTEMFDDYHTGYSLSKSAIDSMTKSFAVAYAEDGITSNAIAPGFVATEMTEHYNVDDKQMTNLLKSLSPIHRNIEPCEIAAAAVFLASREAGAVSGQVIKVNGGGTSLPGGFH